MSDGLLARVMPTVEGRALPASAIEASSAVEATTLGG